MKKNYPQLSSYFKPGFFLVFFLLFGFSVFGQSISNVRTTQTEYCSGDEVNLEFTITNGNGRVRRFDDETTYNVQLSSPSTNTNLYGSFNSNVNPGGNNESDIVNWNFVTAIDWPEANDYRVIISAVNPDVSQSQTSTSNTFSINKPIINPEITNKQWNCKGRSLTLNLTMDYPVQDVSYSWTGPNGFTSNQASPQVEAIEVNSGIYTLELNSKCSSFFLSQEIFFVDENTQDVWRGEIFDNEDFTSSLGYYYEKEEFDQNFGGLFNTSFQWDVCNSGSVATSTFSVEYTLETTRNGIYVVDVGSDNGSELFLNNESIHVNNNISNQWYSGTESFNNVLLGLKKADNLTFEYYELNWSNQVYFQNLELILKNEISIENTTVCLSGQPQEITGDAIPPNLPNGITSRENGYQWYYSEDVSGENKIAINGAISKNFTPDLSTVPFNTPGAYFLFREVKLNSTNNFTNRVYELSYFSNRIKYEVIAPVNQFTETESGNNSWIGHVYDGRNFKNYIGGYLENEEFFQNFGGNEAEFNLSDKICSPSVNASTFSVRYKNQSSRNGLYIVDLTSDDGIRFRINDDLIHDNWVNRVPTTDSNVLLNLDQGTNDLEYEYYENTGQNEVAFQNFRTVSENELGGATEQSICAGEPIQEITADAIQTYNGISLVGTGYQWYYSTEADGDLQPIQNATGQNFTPDFSAQPFDTPGEYYVFRKVSVSSENNRLNGNYDTKIYDNLSTPAQIRIISSPKLIDLNVPEKVCIDQEFNITGNIIGTGPFLVEGTINGTAFSFINISESFSFPFSISENTTIEITKIVDNNGNGCTTTLYEIRNIGMGPNTWIGTENTNWNNTNNWSCNSLPTLETNVLIPENLASGNYPKISAGTNALSKNLTIENNASVFVDDNWLRIAGNLTNNGILNTETGSVSFEGTSAQIIPNSAFENNRIQNLQIDNPLGVTSQAIIEITGTLKVEDGNLDTGNELTLISDENQTALIDGTGNGEVIGLVSMQRYLDKAFGYKYFSSPFQNSVVGDFAPFMDFSDPESGFPHFYRYEENRRVDSLDLDATGWEDYIEPTNILNISEGYALNFGTSSAPQTIELIGEVNNGEIPSRQLENNHREYTKGFHLVGNPYPSPIDWNATNGWTRDNIDDGIYFFTASDDNQYTGTYTAFVNDISTGDSNVDGGSENIIPSMQGFFIKVSDSDTQDLITGSFGMDNRVRTNNFNQEFYRSQITEQKSLLRLEAGFQGANRKDAMVIYFSTYATPNFEKEMDAHKLMNTDPTVPSFYNITESKKELAINAIPFPESRSYKKIPLGIKADQNGPMQINLTSIENLSQNFNVYLIDHVKSIGQNLNRDPEYTFNIKAGTHNSRFELMFSEEEVPSPAIAFNEPFDVKVENGNVVIELNLEESQQGVLRANTITGQIVQIKQGRGKDQVIFDGITSDGVYIINLQVGKERHAKKVVIKK